MLGRIFENLLAEVDPFTGETARKATGSYYTPRPVVEYMVDQSLKEYLKANKEDRLDDYLNRYIYDPPGPEQYLEAVGGSEVLEGLREGGRPW